MQFLPILALGAIFGLLISYAGLNRYNTIAGLSVFEDFTVAKTITLVLGIGILLLAVEMHLGLAVFHLKPFNLMGIVVGGVIFGAGMALLGYCPGTLPISLGQGSVDALLGIAGGYLGGVTFSVFYPYLAPLLGPNLGRESLFSTLGGQFNFPFYLLAGSLSLMLIYLAFWMDTFDKKLNNRHDKRWIATAMGLVLLNLFLFYKSGQNRPLGASSSYPYVGDTVLGLTDIEYYKSTIKSGSWQVIFLLGALVGGFIYSVATKTFRIRLIYEFWEKYRGNNPTERIVIALVGGFILIFGARLADGCTSGHIISGGMQVSWGSFTFALFTFVGFLSTGFFFYRRSRWRLNS